MASRNEPRSLPSAALRLTLVASVMALAACSYVSGTGPRAGGSAAVYERSTHRLERAPEVAAACVADHARASGHIADTVPLYGLESVAVMVKTSAVGEVLAVLSLTPSDTGAVAAATTWKGTMKDREGFVRTLLQGC